MLPKIALCSVLILLMGTLMSYDMPRGWVAGGNRPNEYDMGADIGAGQNGRNAATIRSFKNEVNGYGIMTQMFRADKYKGKRLKMTGYLKTKNVTQWAGLVLKIEGKITNPVTGREQRRVISFDNMYSRFISGTRDFTKYEAVLDVPDSATDISYGARLTGAGQIWFDQISFEVVGNDVPTTSAELQEPANLDFK